MKYDAKELAEMAIRNYEESKKECGGKKCDTDPVGCVAQVFAAPIDTLNRVERENMVLREELNRERFYRECIVSNNGNLDAANEAFRAAYPNPMN